MIIDCPRQITTVSDKIPRVEVCTRCSKSTEEGALLWRLVENILRRLIAPLVESGRW